MKIICENQTGERIVFGWFPPLWLKSVEGLGAKYAVSTLKNSLQDGEYYAGSSAEKRNIVIVLDVLKTEEPEQRKRLLAFFQPRSEGILNFYADEDAPGRKITYYAENVEPSGEAVLKHFTISLICPYPNFKDLSPTKLDLAYWKPLLGFPLVFPGFSGSGNPVEFEGAGCKDSLEILRVRGATTETGTGDKSPDNPYTLTGVTKVTVNGTDYALPQTLYNLPDGTVDSLDVIPGAGTLNIAKAALSGTESWTANSSWDTQAPDYLHAYTMITDRTTTSRIVSSHFPVIYAPSLSRNCIYTESGRAVYVFVAKSLLPTPDIAGLKAWLSAHPVSILYQLATPQTITGTPQTIPVLPGTNTISAAAGTVVVRCLGVFKVGERVAEQIVTINNDTNTTVGLKIVFHARDTVVNPSFENLETHEKFTLPVSMYPGDVIAVTTGVGEKDVLYTSETGDYGPYVWNFGDDWVQLQPGKNTFRYSAESGVDALDVSIEYTKEYWGT